MPHGETLQVPLDRPAAKAPFRLVLPWDLAGDQPAATVGLQSALAAGERHVTLRGVTGSGKTVTMAKVIAEAGRPTLVLAHNKTLAAQLYHEFRGYFPENAVEYFVSYYDYYQPEAYIASTDTYIEKESTINDEIDRLRLSATRSLFERRDIVDVLFSFTFDPVKYLVNPNPTKTGPDISARIVLERVPILARTLAVYTIRTDATTAERIGYIQASGGVLQLLLRGPKDERATGTSGATFKSVYPVFKFEVPEKITP